MHACALSSICCGSLCNCTSTPNPYTNSCAVLFGVFLLGEIVTFKGALGGGIIVAAALVASGVFTPAKGDKTDK